MDTPTKALNTEKTRALRLALAVERWSAAVVLTTAGLGVRGGRVSASTWAFRRRRPAAAAAWSSLRPGIVGQDHADAAGHRRDAEVGGRAPSSMPSAAADVQYTQKLGVG